MAETAISTDEFDPELLDRDLPAGGSGEALEVTDPRLDEISTLVFRSRYDEVPIKVQEIWGSGTLDARLIGYYLLGIFIARGPAGLPLMFRSARKALTEQWGKFIPADRKAALADGNLAWLFEHLLKRLQRQQEAQDAEWRNWWDAGDVEYALQDAQALAQPLEEALTAIALRGRALPRLRRLRRWIAEMLDKPAEAPAPARVVKSVEAEPDEEPEEDDDDMGDPSDDEGPAQRDLADESPAMAMLLRKLEAFQTLVKRGEFQKSAVVALDIESIMANFDPRIYFPRLFAPYFTALHEHAEELEPCMSDPESFSARTLTQLYRVDLGMFLRGR